MSDPMALLAEVAAACPGGKVVHVEQRPAREPAYGAWPAWVPPAVDAAVRGSGISRLWSHQALVAQLAHAGENVAVSTGTASGKSLGYLLPMLSAAHEGSSAVNGRGATAIYLAPTKALGADQLSRIDALAIPGCAPRPSTATPLSTNAAGSGNTPTSS
ncbi:DEAD/DEAH box helicase [Branchiibius cervicis]|uniref:DEAD/DEAH box helicase n=1 Tax=Branchiibius cervicis TaxID=908252 RepID=A0ABW2ANT2_9MICO